MDNPYSLASDRIASSLLPIQQQLQKSMDVTQSILNIVNSYSESISGMMEPVFKAVDRTKKEMNKVRNPATIVSDCLERVAESLKKNYLGWYQRSDSGIYNFDEIDAKIDLAIETISDATIDPSASDELRKARIDFHKINSEKKTTVAEKIQIVIAIIMMLLQMYDSFVASAQSEHQAEMAASAELADQIGQLSDTLRDLIDQIDETGSETPPVDCNPNLTDGAQDNANA